MPSSICSFKPDYFKQTLILVFKAGEVCPNTQCAFRKDAGSKISICFGAQENREWRFDCNIDLLVSDYPSSKQK